MVEIQSAAKNTLKTYWVSGLDEGSDLIAFLNNIKPLVIEKIKSESYSSPVKINVLVKCTFSKDELSDERWFKTENVRILETDDVDEIVDHQFARLLKEKSEHQAKGSGWTSHEISGLELRINKYRPLGGSTFIELPKKIYNTKTVTNVKNNDIFCFKCAIYSKFIAESAPRYLCSRVATYLKDKNFETKYDWDCIKYPVNLKDISKFERQNNISINVFGIDEKNNVYPLKVVDQEQFDHSDVLYLVEENKSHYCWIKSFNKLVHSQITKNRNALYVCKRCFCHFPTQGRLDLHRLDCMINAPSKIIMPRDDEKLLKFKNTGRAMRVPAIVVADFESILPKVQHCCPSDEHSYTCAIEKHEIMSFCFLLICTNNLNFEPISYRGKEAAKVFMNWSREVADLVQNMYRNAAPMNALTPEEREVFESATHCHLCGEELGADRVQDHCHLTGKFRAALHSQCNLKFKMPNFLPVFFHNLSGYDAHFIVPNLAYDKKHIHCIPNSEEKYISFSKSIGNNFSFRFVDTFRFMASALSKLADNLPREKFIHTKRVYGDRLDLVTRKGIFPYEYVDSWEKLEEKCLPPKEKFYSHISGETMDAIKAKLLLQQEEVKYLKKEELKEGQTYETQMEEMVLCPVCYVYYHPRHIAGHEMSEVHRRHAIRHVGGGASSSPMVEIESAVKGRLETYWMSGKRGHTDLVMFLNSNKNLLLEKVKSRLKETALKINILVKAIFHNECCMCKPIAQVAACGARTESSISQAPSYWGLTQDIARGHAFMDELMTMFEEDAALDLSSGDSISPPPPLIPISEMNRPEVPQAATTPPRPQPASRPHASPLPTASPSRPAAQPSSSPPRASPYSLPPETQPLTPPPASSPALESPMSSPHEQRCSPSPEPRSPSIAVLDSQWSTEEETQWPPTSSAAPQVRQSSSVWSRFESATPSPPPSGGVRTQSVITCPIKTPACDDDVVCVRKKVHITYICPIDVDADGEPFLSLEAEEATTSVEKSGTSEELKSSMEKSGTSEELKSSMEKSGTSEEATASMDESWTIDESNEMVGSAVICTAVGELEEAVGTVVAGTEVDWMEAACKVSIVSAVDKVLELQRCSVV
ncbi:uncharacterized protein LOC124166487 [Ischnura elegans]|uniref:uncharacterized protein LOC124166487 n=1 Tax=Ischnura elegans TaxID=197161 RepID=UPI001ED8B72F|nr:uncharacterized protein LOC124166487 [Ischnura elegans]